MNGQFRTNSLHSALTCPLCGAGRTRVRFVLPGGGVLHRCRECTIEFLSPQPDDQQLKKLYSESYYAAWGISGQQDNEGTRSMKRATFRLRLDLIGRFLQPHPDVTPSFPGSTPPASSSLAGPHRVLDVGCATGYFLELAEEEGFQPFGVEFSAYAAARASLRFGTEAIFQGTLEQAQFPAGSFTAITLSDLLEHVRDPVVTMNKANLLLHTAGVILVMTPNTGSVSRLIMGQRWTHYKPEHLFYFNRRSIAFLAERCKLRIVHFERSKKALNLAYLHTQLQVYRHWLLTPLVAAIYRLTPKPLRERNFYLGIGEMVVILKKSP